jgi:predicted Zn-dependent protease
MEGKRFTVSFAMPISSSSVVQLRRALSHLAGALLLAFVVPLHGAEEDPFKGLSVDYGRIIRQAVERFHARDFDAALARIAEADKLAPDTPIALNMRGAIAIERRQFAEGAKYCEEALKKDPKFFPARFNLAEIPFLQKQYAEARRIFGALLAEEPKNELLQYRVFLTHLLEKNEGAARQELEKLKFPSDTGAYYYAHAAWEFAHDNEKEALRWIQAGDWIFTPEKNIYFADVLRDLGWLKRQEQGK